MSDPDPPDRRSIHAMPWNAPRIAAREPGKDNNFNLIRLVAAVGVLVSHAWPISLGRAAREPLQGLLQGITLGTVCVVVFFAISGFFIARSFARSGSATAFLRARALRLMPALVAALLVTAVVMGPLVTSAPAAAYWSAVPGYLLRNASLFFLRYDLPGVFAGNPYGPEINGSLWTLAHEVTCYLAVLGLGVLGLLARPRAFVVLLAGFGAVYAANMVFGLPHRLDSLVQLGLAFAIGVAFWVWRGRIALSVPLGIGLMLVPALLWATPAFRPALVLSLSYLVFLLGFARLPRLAGLARRNDYSYGIYVYAFPVQQLVAMAGVTMPIAAILFALPVTAICAALSWHLVEAPAMRLARPRLPVTAG